MRIGIFIECRPTNGGAFQQSLSTVELLLNSRKTKHEFIVFTPFETTQTRLRKLGIEAVVFKQGLNRFVDLACASGVGRLLSFRLRRLGLKRVGRQLDGLLEDHNIDLVLFNDTTDVVLRLNEYPFIITVHDLDHRDHPDFPESFLNRGFEREEYWNAKTLTRATAVIVNCQYLADRVSKLYNVPKERLVELAFVPSGIVRRAVRGEKLPDIETVATKYNLPAEYLFYPAAYLPHKNHLYILDALLELQEKFGISMHAVFCGHGNNRAQVERQANALGVAERTKFLPFVPEEELPALYRAASVVVVPSYFGPTNLQPVESISLGRPVICSDLPGCREQMRDAAIYCDLSDPLSLANCLYNLNRDPSLVESLVRAGTALSGELSGIDYGARLSPVFDRFERISRRWGLAKGRVREDRN